MRFAKKSPYIVRKAYSHVLHIRSSIQIIITKQLVTLRWRFGRRCALVLSQLNLRYTCEGGERMKGKMLLVVGIMVLALGLVGTPASWANTLDFNGLTFTMEINGSGNLVLGISGVPSGNWTGVTSLDSFAINNFGSATGLSVNTWTTVAGGLSDAPGTDGGCNGSGASFVCFQKAGVTFAAGSTCLLYTSP